MREVTVYTRAGVTPDWQQFAWRRFADKAEEHALPNTADVGERIGSSPTMRFVTPMVNRKCDKRHNRHKGSANDFSHIGAISVKTGGQNRDKKIRVTRPPFGQSGSPGIMRWLFAAPAGLGPPQEGHAHLIRDRCGRLSQPPNASSAAL